MEQSSFISSFENNGKYKISKAYIISFFLLAAISLTCIECVDRYLIYKKSISYKKLRRFNSQLDKVQVIFLGDSHFMAGIDEQWFEMKTFNLSFGGTNYIESYYILRYYIDKMDSLKVVVLPFDLHSFSSFRSDRIINPVFWNQFIDYPELVDVKGKGILKNKYSLAMLSLGAGIKPLMQEFINSVTNKMFTAKENNSDKLEDNSRNYASWDVYRRVEFQFAGSKIIDKDLLDYFERILEMCSEKGVKVVTLQMPLSSVYINYAEKYVTQEYLKDHIFKVDDVNALIYKDLNYIDYFSQNRDMFTADGEHLNAKGREIFKKTIVHDFSEVFTEILAKEESINNK